MNIRVIKKVVSYLSIAAAILPLQVFGATTNDVGLITEVYSANGVMAIRIENGFPNATLEHGCLTPVWAGNTDALGMSSEMKATILTARSLDQQVRVVTSGCTPAGWNRLVAIYII